MNLRKGTPEEDHMREEHMGSVSKLETSALAFALFAITATAMSAQSAAQVR